ncbi:TonB-linked SusC/RagA family outer membrane protein [Lacibacter cauensis]|uniref:TonB-linked SusC/RagA family outer membrane protein n=1 Tax=Lacibacter cauensis TaxID=510947 RepID=A0A562SPV2_9BACT|nr:TonB-dependent receptor [Lacibacter cauensis]TWI83301.1 TonB-linked SusC/RagA family outer membrane protein [Lacibacter cauensis]
MKQFFSLFLLCMCCTIAVAQTRQIKGKVTDETGAGLAGVSVLLSGANNGVQTDANGNFSIAAPGTGAVTLTISYSGYKPQTIKTDGKSEVNISLEKDVAALEDVVVIGYGTIKRKDLTGTVSSIGSAELSKIPVASAAEAITGRLPGVQVTTTDGAPGAEIVIRVRGGGSVTQDNSPLYIVDGFPVNSINDIAPADIATIDILKDAATSAIYGARGANGVVIITTKSAKAGKTTISINSFGTARTLPRTLDVLSPYEFVLANYEYARIQNQSAVDNFTKFFGVYEDLELYKYQKGTNWQKELFGKPVYSQQHNLSITGGTSKTKFSLSATNNTDQGLIKGSGYMRNYVNFKLNHEVSKALRFDYATRFVHTVIDGAGSSGSSSFRIGDAITTRPVNGLADIFTLDPTGTDDDYEQFLKSLINPSKLIAQDYRKRLNYTFNTNLAATWNIVPALSYRTEFSLDLGFGQNKRYYGPLTGESRNVGGNLPLGELTNSNSNGYRWTNTLNYKKEIGKHDFTFLAGQEINVLNRGFSEFNRAKFFAENIQPEKMFANMTLGTQDRHTTTVFAGERIASFFGRVTYQFDSRYLLTLTARADGSTKFAPGKQWGLFPAAAFAWRVSQEEFMSNVKFVNDLKVRLSYGQAGNNRIPNDLWRVQFAPTDFRTIGFGDVANPYYGYASSLLPNPDIKWETTVTRNAGLDFTLFKQRLSGSFDVYWNTTKDLLVESDIPQITGFSKQQRNIGQTSNRGIELGLTGTIVQSKNFQLNGTFNIGINKSKIDKLDGVNEKPFSSNWAGTDLKTQDDYRVYVGRTIGLMYGYVTDGMYTVNDFDSYNPITRTYALKAGVVNVGSFLGGAAGVRPGVMKLKDLNGDGVITAADRQVIGSALPRHTGGFGLSAVYKGFDLSANFNWVVGNDIYNTGKISFNQFYRTSYGNMLNTVNSDNRFKYIDAAGNLVTDLTELGKLNANAKIWSPFSFGTAVPVFHSWAVEDGSFLRLNNLSLGYSLPKNMISSLRMTKVRVYATVYNAFLWTKYSGYDPEVSSTRSDGYSQLTPGVDYSAYPKSRNYTLGINVTF